MAFFETPDAPEPAALPKVIVGAASPLWAYFGAAAAGGVAFWWMTRWARPANLEAMMAVAEPVAAPVLATAEALTAPTVLEPVVEMAPELAAASDPAPTPPVAEATPEPLAAAAIEPGPEPEADAAAEAAPTPVEAAPAPTEGAAEPSAYAWVEPEVTLGFGGDPEVEAPAAAAPASPAKPRVRKAAPPAGEA